MRLDVDVFAAEKLLRAIDRELLDGVDVLATAVPAFPGITFGVFVGQHAALRFHHRAAGEIFRRDQLDVFALPFFFRRDRVKNFRIDFAQAAAGGRSRSRNWKRLAGCREAGLPWYRMKCRRRAIWPGPRVRFVLRTRARSVKRF